MYCTACGQQLVQGAVVCPRCGRPAGVAPFPMIYSRVHRHLQTLSVLWLAYAGWTLVGYLIALPFIAGMTHGWFMHMHTGWPYLGDRLPWLLPFLTVVLVLRSILSAVTGIALMQRKPWARILAIIAAILTILKPITGTALAIYTLWVLAPRLSGQEWDQMAEPQYPGPIQS